MLISKLFIVSILFFNTFVDYPKDKSIFISPVRIPLKLSANFGELRIDHFHSGLDIKTQGTAGKEVVAAATGYIYRISVSPGGFGKALYVKHPSGYSTVYCHLEKFTPEIEDYVKASQYEKKNYIVTLFAAKEKYPVKQGEVIAYSGNSGSSSGPHLHFEIRKSNSEMPVNPLLFEFGTVDNTEPVIEKLVIYPINLNTLINNQNTVKKISVSGGKGNYFIPGENEIIVSGLAGFGIKSFDLQNDSHNKYAVYSIALTIDSLLVFNYVMDSFSFNESRFVNSHIDYETYMKTGEYIERIYVLPNDKLSTYKDLVNRGLFSFNDDKIHLAEIVVTDIHNNKSSLSFKIKAKPAKLNHVADTTYKDLIMMPFNKSNKFVSKNISINFPMGALYDTLYFSYNKTAGTNEMLSDLHYIHNKLTPVHKAYTLSIKPNLIPAGKESKMLIVQLSDDQNKSGAISIWSDGYLSAEVFSFGKFYIGIDSVPPDILTNGHRSGEDLTGKEDIRIKITDDLSGIKSYEPNIDGEWALFEYDQKNNLLIYRFDEQRINKGTKHNLSLKVTDNMDNISIYNHEFIW